MMGTLWTIIAAIFASSGVWTVILYLIQRHDKKKDREDAELQNQSQMLLGLGHDRIIYLGTKYIESGVISEAEYENLNTYLYDPYKKLGGNGTVTKIMEDVKRLPVRKEKH